MITTKIDTPHISSLSELSSNHPDREQLSVAISKEARGVSFDLADFETSTGICTVWSFETGGERTC